VHYFELWKIVKFQKRTKMKKVLLIYSTAIGMVIHIIT